MFAGTCILSRCPAAGICVKIFIGNYNENHAIQERSLHSVLKFLTPISTIKVEYKEENKKRNEFLFIFTLFPNYKSSLPPSPNVTASGVFLKRLLRCKWIRIFAFTRVYLQQHSGHPDSILGQVMWDFWWKRWQRGGFSSTVSVSSNSSHSSSCFTLINDSVIEATYSRCWNRR
jgi:hypothetical protein